MRRSFPVLALFLVLSSCGGDSTSDDAFVELPEVSVTTEAPAATMAPTTTAAPTTTMAPTTTAAPTTTMAPTTTTTTTRPRPRRVDAMLAVADFYGGVAEGDYARAFAAMAPDPGFDVEAPLIAAAAGLFAEVNLDETTGVYEAARFGEDAPIDVATLHCRSRPDDSPRFVTGVSTEFGEFEVECIELGGDDFWSPLGVPTFGTAAWIFGVDGLRLAGGEPSWLGPQAGISGEAARAALAGLEAWARSRLPEPWLGWAAGHRYPFTADQAGAAIALVEEYVAAGYEPVTVSDQASAGTQKVIDAYAALGAGDLDAASGPVVQHNLPLLRDLFERLGGKVWAECEVAGGGPVQVVTCTEHMEDAFYGPAGILPTAKVVWLTGDSGVARISWDRSDPRVFEHLTPAMSVYLGRFGTWLQERDPDLYRESGYTSDPCGCFPFPNPEGATGVLELVPEFVAQSEDYPLQP
ncbi:MAG TPA: hypothetical protein VLD62_09750 [Acidimicrobiia bacterium]|nr:hypothetical protein [Acidimicrobiia bacterium]